MTVDRPAARLALGARLRALVAHHPDALALGIIILAAVAIRLAFAVRVPVFMLRDSISYFLPAWDLIYGYGFDLSIRRTPVYPWFLTGALALFGEDLLAVAFAQHLLGIGSAVLVYILGRQLFGRVAGLIAALVTALNGALLIAEHYLMPEVLLVALLLVTLLVFLRALRGGHRLAFFGSGILLGITLLCKPVAQILIPVLPLMVLIHVRSLRRAVLPSLLIGAGLVAVMVPWVIRNTVVHGAPTTAGALGQTLVARTAKHDTGFDWYDEKRAAEYGDRERIAREIVSRGIRQRLSDGVIYRRVQDRFDMTDAEINQFMRELSTEVILAEPGYYLRGTARMTWQLLQGEPEKLSNDWKTQNARLSREEWDDRVEHLLSRATPAQRNELENASSIASLVQPPAWGPLMPVLFVLGTLLALAVPRLRPALLLSLTVLALLVTSAALDGPVVRYRYPADPLIAIMAAGALTWAGGYLAEALRGRRQGQSGAEPRQRPAPVVAPGRTAEGA